MQPVTRRDQTCCMVARHSGKMKTATVLWIVCSIVAVSGAPKPPGENVAHGNKGTDELEARDDPSTPPPGTASEVDPWEKSKDDAQSLFLNKSDKNDQEPYPMALSDDAYDGQPIRARELERSQPAAAPRGVLEHVVMRAELYGEPPSMGRQANRRKRAERPSLRSALGVPEPHANKVASRYSTANRFKRESELRNEEILALLSLWEAQRRRNSEVKPSYYNQDSYYNQLDPYEEDSSAERDDPDDSWLSEAVAPSGHYARPYYPSHPSQAKSSQYQYGHNYPDYAPEPRYLQTLDALRRKRQWAGFESQNRLVKRFMVAKKRSDPNLYYSEQKSYKPREDLFTLNELLKSSQGQGVAREPSYPISRRMIL